jgi:Fe-S-cluster-containing dehydrogenase component
MERRLPMGIRFRKVRKLVRENLTLNHLMSNPDERCLIPMSISCNHCEKPQCVDACPMHAYAKLPNGIVIQKHYLCIGCTRCVSACPYTAPIYNEAERKTAKCDMCYDRLEAGLKPFCVQTCPNNALKLDTYENLVARYGKSQDLGNLTPAGDYSLLPSGDITNPSIVLVY